MFSKFHGKYPGPGASKISIFYIKNNLKTKSNQNLKIHTIKKKSAPEQSANWEKILKILGTPLIWRAFFIIWRPSCNPFLDVGAFLLRFSTYNYFLMGTCLYFFGGSTHGHHREKNGPHGCFWAFCMGGGKAYSCPPLQTP